MIASMTALWLIFLVGLGFVGFFVVVFTLVLRGLKFAFSPRSSRPRCGSRGDGHVLRCPRHGCGHLNQDQARYCARCGQALLRSPRYVHHG